MAFIKTELRRDDERLKLLKIEICKKYLIDSFVSSSEWIWALQVSIEKEVEDIFWLTFGLEYGDPRDGDCYYLLVMPEETYIIYYDGYYTGEKIKIGIFEGVSDFKKYDRKYLEEIINEISMLDGWEFKMEKIIRKIRKVY